MVTINIGMGNNPVPFAHIEAALKHKYPEAVVRLDRSSYNGVPEETLVAQANYIPNEVLQDLCMLLNQECIGRKISATPWTSLGELVWHPNVTPHMEFDPKFFIEF
jgi:hypothetical protein